VASIRTTLATAGTLAALGGLTAFAVGAGDARPEAEQVAAPAPAPAEQVRTEVVTRTIHRRESDGTSRRGGGTAQVASSSSGGEDRPGANVQVASSSPGVEHRRGRGADDVGFDDHGGDDGHRGHGRGGDDDDGFDDHGGGEDGDDRGGDDDNSGHGGGGEDNSGHGGGDD
jgi:hypothetical protein